MPRARGVAVVLAVLCCGLVITAVALRPGRVGQDPQAGQGTRSGQAGGGRSGLAGQRRPSGQDGRSGPGAKAGLSGQPGSGHRCYRTAIVAVDGRRPGTGQPRCRRPLPGQQAAAAAAGTGIRLRHRRCGNRPGAGGQGPARRVPASQHAQGADRDNADSVAEPRRRGRRHPAGDLGRAERGRSQARPALSGVQLVQGPVADLGQRCRGVPGRGQPALSTGRSR